MGGQGWVEDIWGGSSKCIDHIQAVLALKEETRDTGVESLYRPQKPRGKEEDPELSPEVEI